jgi:predicted sulfurtransferase
MEKYPGKDFLGTLFTFDNRLVMDFGGEREIIGKCKKCEAKTEQYQNCANGECNLLFLLCDDCTEEGSPIFCSDTCKTKAVHIVQRVR